MISLVALYCHLSDEPVPGNIGEPLDVLNTYTLRCCQCLALDDYTKPGKYKVETLICYFAVEYLRLPYAQIGTSILFSTILRLAVHTGYHRDPKHNKDMSILEGETRRRVWLLLIDVDAQTSFQFGVNTLITPDSYDTLLPTNLYDEDLDENVTELPPARPLTEQTRVLPMLLKNKIESVFFEIQSTLYSNNQVSYEQIMDLERKLTSGYETIPPNMQMRDFSQSIADPIDIVMQRYSRELLYQKCRSVLHRRFISMGRRDPTYSYSRLACLDSAARTMRHQYVLHIESQPLGRLSKDRWLFTSLTTHDFLLAAMILCLELSYMLKSEKSPSQEAPIQQGFTKEQLLEILRTSRRIWEQHRRESAEANRAFQIISRMLTMATGTSEFESGSEGGGSDYSDLQQPSAYTIPQASGMFSS
jgi:hypothetical protein